MKKLAALLALVLALMTPFAISEETATATHYESEYGFSIDFDAEKWQVLDKNTANSMIDVGINMMGFDEASIAQYSELVKTAEIVYMFNKDGSGANLNVVRTVGMTGLTIDMMPMLEEMLVAQYTEIYAGAKLDYSQFSTFGENKYYELCISITVADSFEMKLVQYMTVFGDNMYVITLGSAPVATGEFEASAEDFALVEEDVHKILESFKAL